MGSTKRVAQILEDGGVIVFPTDTAYGLGVDTTDEKAVERLFELKGRDREKPIHIVVRDIAMALDYALIDKKARVLMDAFLPGPLTVVVPKKSNVSDVLTAGKSTVGIRIPAHEMALGIVEELGKPITATSANKSGDSTPYNIEDVKESFGKQFSEIDMVVDVGELPKVPPSTLVTLQNGEVIILREGPVTRDEILKVLS